MEFKDYYRTLGVEKTANADDIKKAFRRLARKYHPDVSKEPDAAARMSELNEANAVLSDPEKRAAYDTLGSQAQAGREFRPPPNWDAGFEFSSGAGGAQAGSGGADFSDFFEELFGRHARAAQSGRGMGGGSAGAQRTQSAAFRGEDHHARIELDLVDAYQGAERNLSLRGARLDEHGQVAVAERTLSVAIPKGVREGQQIRLAAQGGEGFGGGSRGDLFLEVSFRPDPRFRVQGRDVTQNVPLAPWEAALGAQVEVPMPAGGTIEVTVPAGWKKGKKLRLKGRGIPGRADADAGGDMYLELELALPPADTPKARELYETMKRELGGLVRPARSERRLMRDEYRQHRFRKNNPPGRPRARRRDARRAGPERRGVRACLPRRARLGGRAHRGRPARSCRPGRRAALALHQCEPGARASHGAVRAGVRCEPGTGRTGRRPGRRSRALARAAQGGGPALLTDGNTTIHPAGQGAQALLLLSLQT